MNKPINQPNNPPNAGRGMGYIPPGYTPVKDKTLLERAEELLVLAQKELRAMREKIAYLELIEQEHAYLKRLIDMHHHIINPIGGYEAAEEVVERTIEQFVKDAQEEKLQGLLGGDAAGVTTSVAPGVTPTKP